MSIFLLIRSGVPLKYNLNKYILELRALYLPGGALHTPSSFSSMYFKNRVLHLCLGQPRPRSSYLCFLLSWEDRHVSPHPVFIVFIGWDGGLNNFSPRLTSNYNPLNLCLLSTRPCYNLNIFWTNCLACGKFKQDIYKNHNISIRARAS